jgi:serine phosphatase RsbU (regulator of sigma subunit)
LVEALAQDTLLYVLLDPVEHLPAAQRLHALSQATQHPAALAISHLLAGFQASAATHYEAGLAELAVALRHFANTPHTLGHAFAWALAGMGHATLGNYEEALQHHLAALRLTEESPAPAEAAFVRYCAGSFYTDVNQPDLALALFEEGIHFGRLTPHFALPLARCLNGAGAIRIAREEYETGIALEREALALYEANGLQNGVGRCLHDLGLAYLKRGDRAQGVEYLHKALEIRRTLPNAEGMVTTLVALAELEREPAATHTLLQEALQAARRLGNRPKQALILKRLADCCEASDQPALALTYFKEYHELHQQMARFELEQQLRQLETAQEAEHQRLQNRELAHANGSLAKALGNIHESIAYAQQIQLALQPTPQQLARTLPQSLLLFRPRDTVSGDFFWLHTAPGRVFVAVGDCTGHGVPGALLSMLAISLLNEGVKAPDAGCPAQLLHFVDQGLRSRLASSHLQDGLEAAVVVLHTQPQRTRVKYAGAGMPLYYQPHPGAPIETLPAHKGTLGSRQQPIGHFLPTEFELETNGASTFFAASDGYRDQFGAEQGGRLQRLGSRRFVNVLAAASALPPAAALAHLERELDAWRGSQPQVDDILVLGFRV